MAVKCSEQNAAFSFLSFALLFHLMLREKRSSVAFPTRDGLCSCDSSFLSFQQVDACSTWVAAVSLILAGSGSPCLILFVQTMMQLRYPVRAHLVPLMSVNNCS